MINHQSFVSGLRLSCVLLLTGLISSHVSADSIRLRSKVVVTDVVVRLSDVATLEGDTVQALADTPVAKLDVNQPTATLTQQTLRNELTKLNVNWAHISLKGFDECQILIESIQPENKSKTSDPAIVAPASPIRANPEGEISADSQDTVRTRLTAWVRSMHGTQGDDIRIQFNDRDGQVIDAVAGQDLFTFATSSTTHLGRVPVTIERFRDEKLVDTQRVTLEVTQRHLALVALRSVNRGQVINFDDVEIREVFCDRQEPNLITKIDDAIGLICSAQLREGSLIRTSDIRAALLVRRNEPIRVQALAGGVKVITLARALEDGSEGQMIQVRNERSRETFMVRVVGTRQGLLVLDAPVVPDLRNQQKSAENKPKAASSQGTK